MNDEYFTLLTDVFSYLKKDNIWGKVGDKVRLIKRLGTCLLLENSNGITFPVNEKKVMPYTPPKHKHQNQKNLF